MGKIKTKSLRTSMAVTFFITICVTALLSSVTLLAANQVQHKILKKRYMTINSPDFQMDEDTGNYMLDIDNNNITWQPLSTWDTVVYYGSYAAMVGLPFLYCCRDWGGCGGILPKEASGAYHTATEWRRKNTGG